jgi:PAT family beta-lactamase induction signal transducer AmpG
MKDVRLKTIKSYSPAWWVPTLYFSEGLPYVAAATVSVLMYKDLGIPNAQIAFFTTLIMWPWSLKPLWSPLLEMFKTKKYFVIATQAAGGVFFGLLALSLPLNGFFQYSLVLFAIIAFNSATHDIAADGVYINTLNHQQQAKYVGWQGAFYNIAKVLSQGGLIWLAGYLTTYIGITHAWMIVMGLFSVILFAMGLYHLKMLPTSGTSNHIHSAKEAFQTFSDVISSFLKKKYVGWGILFIILFRFAEGQLVKIVPLFLKDSRAVGGLGLDNQEIGLAYGVFGAAAFVVGSILGGYFVKIRGLKSSLMWLAIIFNIPDLVYAILAFTQPENLAIIAGLIVCEWLGYGFGFIGVILFMMQQIAPGKYKMAHYAIATAIMGLGFMLPSMISGYLSDWLGYKNFFLWVMIATLPSFFVAWRVPFKEIESDN